MRPELQPIWAEYARVAGEHSGWHEAAVYLRESKREQVEGYSPGAQLKGTLDEAARQHFWIPESNVFLDLMSGRREDRVAFQDMLATARSGKIAAVVVLHTSRFARNALVSRKYKDELRRRGVKVIAINAPFDVARPEGKFAERMMEAVDEFTSDTIGWWVGVGLREKHERGEPLGLLPETFYRDAGGAILPHPELSAVVLDGARRYATGRVGFGDLARWCEREGIRTPSGRALTDEWWRNSLANPTNAGYVGYHRKRGATELRRAAFSGFMPLELFERVQQVRQQRARRPKQGANYRVYLLSGLAWCAACGAQVTACEKRRMRCRRSAQHARCREPSAPAERLEQQLGAWLCSAFALPANLKVKVAALVRAKARGQGSLQSVERAATVRLAIKRVTDAYTWGAMGEADYREQLRDLKAQLDRLDTAPDERRMMTAIKVAQDLAATWDRARPERRKELVAALFETIRVGGGRIVSVKPKSAVLPLIAVTVANVQTKDWRSRPDSNRRSRP
jgi:site-specific DNA recombinase